MGPSASDMTAVPVIAWESFADIVLPTKPTRPARTQRTALRREHTPHDPYRSSERKSFSWRAATPDAPLAKDTKSHRAKRMAITALTRLTPRQATPAMMRVVRAESPYCAPLCGCELLS